MTPPLTTIDQRNTTRLIPAKYSDDSVLARIADDDGHLQGIFALDHATNDRLRAEHDLLPGIAAGELVFDVPHYRIINAAFCHASPTGARFNGPDRGAWYAGFDTQTSLAEVTFHKALALSEINHFHDTATYDAYHADFEGDYHDIRGNPAFKNCLRTDDYRPAQVLAETLHAKGSKGVIYPSVRAANGDCIACFAPGDLRAVRKGRRFTLVWSGVPEPTVTSAAH